MNRAEIKDMDADNIFDYGFCGTRSAGHEGCRRFMNIMHKILKERK